MFSAFCIITAVGAQSFQHSAKPLVLLVHIASSALYIRTGVDA